MTIKRFDISSAAFLSAADFNLSNREMNVIIDICCDHNIKIVAIDKKIANLFDDTDCIEYALCRKNGIILIKDDFKGWDPGEILFVIFHELGHLVAEGGWDSEEMADQFALKQLRRLYRSIKAQKIYRSALLKLEGDYLDQLKDDPDYSFRYKYLI